MPPAVRSVPGKIWKHGTIGMVRLLVTFMEQHQAPPGDPPPAPAGAEIAREELSVAEYLSLYRHVGEAVQWDSRLRMPETELKALLAADSTIIHVLSLNGTRVGLLEAIRHVDGNIEIANFGLITSAQGKRLGPYFLESTLRSLWKETPRRVWLHTDTHDHPAAIRTYEKAGFSVVERRWMDFPD
jgi:ribosomal protein S18 acetylase RimI-like enzyme